MKALFFNDFYKDHVADKIKEVFLEAIYQPLIVQDGIYVELGANQGIFTLWAYQHAKKIYAVEPSKDHLEVLNMMLKQNEMLDKVEVIPKAISNKNGTATFYHNANTTMNSLNEVVKDEKLESETVETVTIKKLFDDYKIDHVDLLNLDVEGEEFNILSSDEFTEVAPKIKTMVVEYHAWTNTSFVQLITMLEDRGFTIEKANTQATVFIAKHE